MNLGGWDFDSFGAESLEIAWTVFLVGNFEAYRHDLAEVDVGIAGFPDRMAFAVVHIGARSRHGHGPFVVGIHLELIHRMILVDYEWAGCQMGERLED